MNKQEIYDFIKNKNIWYEITEHKAVFNMDELSEIEIPYPEYDAKNLFVRDDKKRNYYLITVKGNKRVRIDTIQIKKYAIIIKNRDILGYNWKRTLFKIMITNNTNYMCCFLMFKIILERGF